MSYPFDDWLPLTFAALMGLSILVYVVLDGFDLGVGILSIGAKDEEKDILVGSIGPFWDANETWLVMAVGLLLVAFPFAHGMILTALYLPATLLLLALILRGVAFEFRAKAPAGHKRAWDRCFFAGSLLAALAQGFMLGIYVLGLDQSWSGLLFGLLTGVCLAAAYALIGAVWLIAKTEGALQQKAVRWARASLWLAALGLLAISLSSPLASPRIFDKWLAFPNILLLAPVPLITLGLLAALAWTLRKAPLARERWAWAPFAITTGIFCLAFFGLAYSFFPYVVPEQMTIWEAASARESLAIILVGAGITMPMIAAYSLYAYRVFRGKATALRYE
ncbi:MAG: cytochrome d ubiquinol oxidase subunit II [Pseudomonadota bacterium]